MGLHSLKWTVAVYGKGRPFRKSAIECEKWPFISRNNSPNAEVASHFWKQLKKVISRNGYVRDSTIVKETGCSDKTRKR